MILSAIVAVRLYVVNRRYRDDEPRT